MLPPQLQKLWDKVPQGKKRPVAIAIVAIIGALVLMSVYKMKTAANREKVVAKEQTAQIQLEKDQLKNSLVAEVRRTVSEADKKVETLNKVVEDLVKENKRLGSMIDGKGLNPKEKNPGLESKPLASEPMKIELPEPPNKGIAPLGAPSMGYPPAPVAGTPANPAKPKIVYVGGIKSDSVAQPASANSGDEKKKDTIYLPPSFMDATLLSGVTAPTMTKDKKDPLPVIFRINDLAVLPNAVKANLKGCFVLGEAEGKLRDYRAHTRLTTLSCVDKKGGAVIDQAVKGFVVDSDDGKVGMAGHAVAKMDLAVGRAVWAGLIGGLGEGIKMSTTQTQLTDEGSIGQVLTDTETKTIMKYGLGQGISDGAKELQKFYLALAEESSPVIEVGATKKVTLVISEGVDLVIKPQNLQGVKNDV